MGLIEKPRHTREQPVATLPDDIGQEIMDGVVRRATDDPFCLPHPEKVNSRYKEDEPKVMWDQHRTQYEVGGVKKGEGLIGVYFYD